MGNPNGTMVLVEFTDFACGYCRASVPEVDALIAADPNLKVVVRELPIIAPTSADAARWGLAAAEQGKYPAFHKAMFAAGRTDAASIESAAKASGLDLDRARKFIADPRVDWEPEKQHRTGPSTSELTGAATGWWAISCWQGPWAVMSWARRSRRLAAVGATGDPGRGRIRISVLAGPKTC